MNSSSLYICSFSQREKPVLSVEPGLRFHAKSNGRDGWMFYCLFLLFIFQIFHCYALIGAGLLRLAV